MLTLALAKFKNVPVMAPLELSTSIFPPRVATKIRPVPSLAITRSCGAPSAEGMVTNGVKRAVTVPVLIGSVKTACAGGVQIPNDARSNGLAQRIHERCIGFSLTWPNNSALNRQEQSA